jgi:hypothetical protein
MWAVVIIAMVAEGGTEGHNPGVAVTTLQFQSEQLCHSAAMTLSLVGHGPGGSDHFVIAKCVQLSAPAGGGTGPTGTGGYGGIANDRRSRHVGRDLFE